MKIGIDFGGKIMKRVFALFLALTVTLGVLTVMPAAVSAEGVYECGDYSYVLEPDGGTEVAEITAYSGTNSRNRAEAERAAFKANFPGISVYLSYSEPYFKIRVGNYLTRLKAYKDLKRIQLTYPNAYIVPEKINFKE